MFYQVLGVLHSSSSTQLQSVLVPLNVLDSIHVFFPYNILYILFNVLLHTQGVPQSYIKKKSQGIKVYY